MEEKKTVGAFASELLQKAPETRDPIEIERELHTDYEAEVLKCLESGKKQYSTDFFVVVVTKREPLMPNVFRNYFFSRSSCPTPDYDQTVYHYIRKDDALHFMWVIPSRDTAHLFRENALNIVPEEKELLQYILDFADGTLMRKALKINGEQYILNQIAGE